MSTERALPPPPPPRGRHREVWVGLFVIAGLVGTVITLGILTDAALFRGRYEVLTELPSAGGIRKGDPVQMRGVNIGRIIGFRIQQQSVEVRLEIEGEYAIAADSHVELRSSGLLGGMVADVIAGTSPQAAGWGDRLPGKAASGVFDRMDALAAQAGQIGTRVQSMLSDQLVRDTQSGAAEGRQALQELAGLLREQRGELRTLTGSLKRSADHVERLTSSPELSRTAKRLDGLSERLEATLTTLDRSAVSLDAILGRMDRGEGTLGRLSRDDSLYRNLNEASAGIAAASQEMGALARDLREHPGRYVHVSLF